MDQDSGIEALTPSEEAFFESGGTTAPEEIISSEGDSTESKPLAAQADEVAAPEVKPVVEKEKTVPLAALHQARMELKEYKERMARVEEQFQQFQQAAQQRQLQEQQQYLPQPDTDPVGYFQMETQRLQQELQQIKQGQQQFVTQQQQEQQEQHFRRTFGQIESEFTGRTPDYQQATAYLRNNLVETLVNNGISPQEATTYMEQQVRNLVTQAMHVGSNPAEMAYLMAQQRGYRAPQAAQAEQAAPAMSNADKIAQVNKGQAAAKSLSATGGKSKGELTLEAMAEMDADELEKHWNQLGKMM